MKYRSHSLQKAVVFTNDAMRNKCKRSRMMMKTIIITITAIIIITIIMAITTTTTVIIIPFQA